VSARLDLGGLVVEWFDLPGLRATDDPVEREAIALAQPLLADADFVVSLAAPGIPWLDGGRAPDLRVAAKCDLARGAGDDTLARADLAVSAATGEGLDALRRRIRDMLVPPEDRANERPWRFDARLDTARG
jgi:tRNA U34 5-carboxymethylaminomethyl modifying GTPase MnmE/TrmE